MANQIGKISDPVGPISAIADKSKLPRQSAVNVEDDEKLKYESCKVVQQSHFISP